MGTKANIEKLLNDDGISVVINGKFCTVGNLPADTTLKCYLRQHLGLKGTKFMCLEGGCGACIVAATVPDPFTGKDRTIAVNSCLVPIYLCHGWAITTVEHLGNRFDGYGEIQSELARKNGTQCGYCSPGMVMNMYSLLENRKSEGKPAPTMEEIENSFAGNLCRCTGYRSILDAFKSFGSDAPKPLVKQCKDIEDVVEKCTGTSCANYKSSCCAQNEYRSEFIELECAATFLKLQLEGDAKWYHVSFIKEVFEILVGVDGEYRIVHGNTAQGAYRPSQLPTTYIDVTRVAELHTRGIVDNCIIFGANITLNDAKEFCYQVAQTDGESFCYAKQFGDHLDKIANVPVRNIGSLAGNLSLKHEHRDFPSDVFLLLESVRATMTIETTTGQTFEMSPLEYLGTDMYKKLITKICLPSWDSRRYEYRSYKIAPRAQNSHAIVNAAFLFKVDKINKCTVLETPRIVIGGIRPNFVHARGTEGVVVGKQLLRQSHLQEILRVLSSEVNPDHNLPEASPEYRKGLACSLFYKFVLGLAPEQIDSKLRSGAEPLHRPLSSGQQDYETDPTLWPINKPVQKLEALRQCSGETEYVNDIPNRRGDLFAAVVIAKQGIAAAFLIDPSPAMFGRPLFAPTVNKPKLAAAGCTLESEIPGVVAFYSCGDIPGPNNFMPMNLHPFLPEQIFAEKLILHAGQALGVVVAETERLARLAAKKVRVTYTATARPVTNFLAQIIAADPTKVIEAAKIEPTEIKDNVEYLIKGSHSLFGQYHFTMETQTCYCVPIEDGMNVFSSTQWPTFVQEVVSSALKIQQNRVNVTVRSVGGAFGSKISRSNQIASICAVAAHLTRRSVHLTLTIEDNMQMIGKRFPCHTQYEVGVNEYGVIQYLNAKLYQDAGINPNECDVPATLRSFTNIYNSTRWSVIGYFVLTDNATNTWCRAPNSTEGLAMIEYIMEHIARVVNRDPVAVKLANINLAENEKIPKMFESIKQSSEFDKRKHDIDEYNEANRWKKRGIVCIPMSYQLRYPLVFHVLMSINGNDGTVSITHGGVEIGQGINTKAAQVCAYMFKIPVEDVIVKPTMNITSANDSTTGSSMTSESVAYAVQEACKILLARLEPVRQKWPLVGWKELIKLAYIDLVDMTCSFMANLQEPKEEYMVNGVAVTEVLLDVLTGEKQICRVDLLEDAGLSINPNMDIGQIEGAFVMGLGYYTLEELIYDDKTGVLLNDRTWNYWPPGFKDIPIIFKVELLKGNRKPPDVCGAKATGEPPLTLSVSCPFALCNAIQSARRDSGNEDKWFTFENPLSCERIWLYSLTDLSQYKI